MDLLEKSIGTLKKSLLAWVAIAIALGCGAGSCFGLADGAADQALMITLYLAMDSFGTACNVIGDGAIAMVVDRMAAGARPAAPDGGRKENP